jgi:diguanylate cyclase (GGDEF)-like protein
LHYAYQNGEVIECFETVFWHTSQQPVLVECTVVPLNINGQHEGSVVAFRDISKRKLLEEELIWQANHDSLTKLYNRFYFEKQLKKEFYNVKNGEGQSALLYLDLDRFKYINDTAGHNAGDQLLVEISTLLLSRVRESDMLARLGGDEFAIILRHVTESTVYSIAENVRGLLQDYNFRYGGKHYQLNGSIGIAIINQETSSPEEALANADLACNIAKRRGRNQTHIYVADCDDKIAMDLELGWSAKLRDALQNNHFVIHYQPIVALADIDFETLPASDGELWDHLCNQLPYMQHHYEVLIRLPGTDGEMISPHAFLPTAERFNMMKEIDRWMLTHAMQELAKQHIHRDDTVFAINLSGHTVDDQSLPKFIKSLLKDFGIRPDALIFEITETTAIENISAARKFIHELTHLGCRFALDDFGSGFSSFSHLKHLDVDFVKIDGQFIRGMANNSADKSIVSSINDIAHSLGKRTIAEYVENPDVLRYLKECGVDYVQGFYISHPFSELEKTCDPAITNIIPLKINTKS